MESAASKNPSPERTGTAAGLSAGLPAGLYVRVSTLNQVERESLSTQESRLKAYCTANGFQVYKVYKDAGISAKDTKRPQLESLMEDCRRGKIQAVLVTALDRITRSLRDLIKLVDFFQENSIRFISITQSIDSSTSLGRFTRDLLGLMARLEREVVAERVANDMYHRASLGKWNGGIVPYGYTTFQRIVDEMTEKGVPEEKARKKAGELVPEPKKLYTDPEEAEVVKRIFDTFIETRSIRKTTHTLNSLGIKTRKGTTWASSSIHRILTNPTYIGKIWYGKRKTDLETGRLKKVQEEGWKVASGLHKPIVPEKIFRQAQESLDSISRKPTRAFRTYLLSGLLRCGKCGGPMHGYTFAKKSSGKAYSYYKCHNYGSKGTTVCTGMTVPARELEDFVVQTLNDLSKDKPFLQDKEKMLAFLREEAKPKKRKENLERLRRNEKDLEARLETLLEKLESGLIDDLDFKRRYEKIKAQLNENRLAQEKISDSGDQSQVAYDALKASFEEIYSFGKNWEFLDDQTRARKISTIVKKIKVHEEKIEMQVYLDVKEAFRRDRGSWQQRA
ncbi:MAG: recombinase family protein [Nitrospirota bacterium]